MKYLSHFHIVIALGLVLSFSIRMPAQQTPYVVGSTVTGTVFCGDTSAPARFAKVVLKSIEPSHAGEDFMKNLQENLQKMAAAGGTCSRALCNVNGWRTRTDSRMIKSRPPSTMERTVGMS